MLTIKPLVFHPFLTDPLYDYSVRTAVGLFYLIMTKPNLYLIVTPHQDGTYTPSFGNELKIFEEVQVFLTECHMKCLEHTYQTNVANWFELPEPKLQNYLIWWDGDGGEWYNCQAHSVEEAKELCRNNCTKGTEYEGTRYDDPDQVIIFDVYLKVE